MLRNPCKPCIVNVICSSSCYKLDAHLNSLKRVREGLKFLIAGFYIAVLVVTLLTVIFEKVLYGG